MTPSRFLTDEGDVDLPVVLAEYLRRLDAYPTRSESDVACTLNCEVCTEQAIWARRVEAGQFVVSAREAYELEGRH